MKKILVLIVIISLISVLALANTEYKIYSELLGTLQMYDEEGNLTGSTVEQVKEIQKRIGDDTEIEIVPWVRGLTAIQNEDNVILFSTALNDEREPLMKWLGPLEIKIIALYVKKDSGIRINSIEEAKNLSRIGTLRGDAREELLLSQGFKNLDSANNYINNIKKLYAERIDAVIESPDTFFEACMQSGIPPDAFKEEYLIVSIGLYIAFSKNFPSELFNKWKEAFKNMHEDGTFEKIYRRWHPNADLPEFLVIE
jgi:polar amino acid transport system substrate-binding protein